MAHDNPTDAELLEASAELAAMPRNDPNYNRELVEQAHEVKTVANAVGSIEIVDGRDPHIRVNTNRPRDNPLTRRTAQTMGKLFEAPVRFVEAPSPLKPEGKYHQPPRHHHYKYDGRD
jgi:hypothetical protein